MKKSSTWMLALMIAGSFLFLSCGGEKSEETTTTGEEITEEAAPQEERASPLRTINGTINGKKVTVQYGAPSMKNRVIWGDLVPYNEVWRTGANESTYVDFSTDVTVEGKPLQAGKYSLFTVPKEKGKWTVIFNSDWDLEHGHFQYKEENDVLRVESTPSWETDNQEQLTIAIEAPGIVVRWAKLKLPIVIE